MTSLLLEYTLLASYSITSVTMNIHHSQGAVECGCDSGRIQTTHGSTSRTHNNQQNELPTNPTLLSSNWTSSTRAYRDPSRREENQQGIRDDVEPPNKEDREEELDDNYAHSFKHSFHCWVARWDA